MTAAKQHAQFPKIQVWSSLLNVGSRSLPLLLMAALFGAGVAGSYAFAQIAFSLPRRVFATGIGDVFYAGGAAEWNETMSLSNTIQKALSLLKVTLTFPIVSVGLLGPFLFETVFGAQWHEAGVYAQILSPCMLMGLVATPIAGVFLIVRRASMLLLYNVALLIGMPGALLVGGLFGGSRTALICLSLVGASVYLHQVIVIVSLAGGNMRGLVQLLRETGQALVFVLPAAVVYWMGSSTWVTGCMFGAVTVSYLALLYVREPILRRGLRSAVCRLRTERSSRAIP